MKAIVVYDSRYGNTEKISMDLANGLRQNGIEVTCARTTETKPEELRNFDLVAIGGPTEWHSASSKTKEFLAKLKQVDLKGKFGFAFDTKLDSWWAGDASDSIENVLESCGAQMIMSNASAFVNSPKEKKERVEKSVENPDETKEERKRRKLEQKEMKRGSIVLKEGMEQKFEQLGIQLGRKLLGQLVST